MPKDLSQALRVTGTLHIVAVSGQNMSILAGFMGRMLGWFGRLAVVSKRLQYLAISGEFFSCAVGDYGAYCVAGGSDRETSELS